MAISLLDWTPVRPCLHKVIVLYLARGTLVILNWFFFVWKDRRERKQGVAALIEWWWVDGEIFGILGSTWRAVARSCWLGRETHKWGGRRFSMSYHWVWCTMWIQHYQDAMVWYNSVENLWCCMETHKWGEWRNLRWVLRFPQTPHLTQSEMQLLIRLASFLLHISDKKVGRQWKVKTCFR